jgi:hypothetical protein
MKTKEKVPVMRKVEFPENWMQKDQTNDQRVSSSDKSHRFWRLVAEKEFPTVPWSVLS